MQRAVKTLVSSYSAGLQKVPEGFRNHLRSQRALVGPSEENLRPHTDW